MLQLCHLDFHQTSWLIVELSLLVEMVETEYISDVNYFNKTVVEENTDPEVLTKKNYRNTDLYQKRFFFPEVTI